ncbi:MAG: argininosuccinate lyase [Candidatus Bathyarchaeota archaeon]|nr:argininosuccinate lyase [Candidatus Bathyarchaeota archaeon]
MSKPVTQGSLFRSRIAKEFDKKTAEFHTSANEDLRIFEDDLNCTTAHDIMLHEQGIIPAKEIKLILTALDGIRQKWRAGEVTIGAEYEDVHEYIETTVIKQIGIEAGGMIHTGRSRNDQVVTDIKLRLREDIIALGEATLNLVDALQKRAAEHADTPMILYTHGQHAQVGTMGAYLSAHADILLRDQQRLAELYARVNTNPLGAGPVGGTSININRKRTTELLGFDSIHENAIDATSSRDWAVETASVCAITMGDLSRLSADILEWSTVEFGYIELADEYASSSSIMPQKKNPSTIELLRGKTGEAYGDLVSLLTMEKGLASGYVQDLQETKLTLWRTVYNTQICLEIMAGAVATMKIKPERLAKPLQGNFAMAVEVAETLANEANLSFREAYKIAADLTNLTISRGSTLDKLTPKDVEESAAKLYKKKVKVTQVLVDKATDPKQSLERRVSLGSPSPKEVKRMLKEHAVAAKKQRADLEKKKGAVEATLKSLQSTAAKLSK